MNVGITCYPTVGGSGAVAVELGKQLARRGHTIHFISYRLPFRLGDFHQNISFHEVDVSSYVLFEYPPHDLALAAKMAEVAREHRLDLLHVHYAIPHAIAGFLAQQMLGARRAEADHDPPRDRRHPRRSGPVFLRDHSLRDRALQRRDGRLGVPAQDDGAGVPDPATASR